MMPHATHTCNKIESESSICFGVVSSIYWCQIEHSRTCTPREREFYNILCICPPTPAMSIVLKLYKQTYMNR